MAINKKLIHFKNKEDFDREVANGNILDHSIVFVKDSKEIYTHGTSYGSIKWSIIKPLNIFTVEGYEEEFTFEEGMTWGEFCESEYNTLGWTAYADQVETYSYSNGSDDFFGYSEWGWLEPEKDVWYSGELGTDVLIIPEHHYYENHDSSGIGGGGDWSLDKQNEPSKEE